MPSGRSSIGLTAPKVLAAAGRAMTNPVWSELLLHSRTTGDARGYRTCPSTAGALGQLLDGFVERIERPIGAAEPRLAGRTAGDDVGAVGSPGQRTVAAAVAAGRPVQRAGDRAARGR